MFRISREANSWFEKLNNNENKLFKTKFDFYYLLLMMGLTSLQKKPIESDALDLTRDFPIEFNGSKLLIIGILVHTELKRLAIPIDNKANVQEKFIELVDPDSSSKLSNRGFSMMNEYTSFGFSLLKERLGSSPELANEFIIDIYKQIKSNIDTY